MSCSEYDKPGSLYEPLSQSRAEQCLGIGWRDNTICEQGRLDEEGEKIEIFRENKR